MLKTRRPLPSSLGSLPTLVDSSLFLGESGRCQEKLILRNLITSLRNVFILRLVRRRRSWRRDRSCCRSVHICPSSPAIFLTTMFVDMQARKEKLMAQIKNELAINGAQELINVRNCQALLPLPTTHSLFQKINEKCFYKCVTKPSTSLSGSEEVGAVFNLSLTG